MTAQYGYSMVGFGMGFGFIWFAVLAALVVVPFWRILPRVGVPGWVGLFAIFPPGVLILLWVVAFRQPVDGGQT